MKRPLRSAREGYVDGLLQAGALDRRVVTIDGDVSRSIGSNVFADSFPGRSFNLGASEQDMMGEAAGLALAGCIPFVATYSVFATGRAWDQIRTAICYMDLDVKIAGAHAGISVGPDGATHQALEDMALMRVLPNMKVLAPADASQTRAAVLAALAAPGPVYIRFGKNPVPRIYPDDSTVEPGKGNLLREGSDILIAACGPMVAEALSAAELLATASISTSVIDMVSVKPIDADLVLSQAKGKGGVVTAEDHQLAGGLFGALAELLGRECPMPIDGVGVEDAFGTGGSPSEVMEEYGLTAVNIFRKAVTLLQRKGC